MAGALTPEGGEVAGVRARTAAVIRCGPALAGSAAGPMRPGRARDRISKFSLLARNSAGPAALNQPFGRGAGKEG
ncbi:hypothetical protein GCM10017567_49800 [Amycolatopsis bullii]|uniref:Uncharacterized protein n=1 Tax=Amycolatopsis bullii TaxID=941987 RepID=A0ABQ3KHQ9_9PSEU|nr:hypothetical protein GCM10017567_49800 [Amycolatopsis bullii]